MNAIVQTLMNNLMRKNPQGYQVVNQMMTNGGNPEAMLKQILGNATPEQRQSVLNQAKSYGCPENMLSRIQNMK